VTLVEALVAYALLIALHYAVSWSRVRSKFIAAWLDAEPILLYFDGGCLHRTLRRARIRQNDVEAAVRGKGIASLNDVDAVVLEPNGELSILPKQQGHRELIAELRQ
jgi:uncharacterized membrane protein YcaP (DUF421 family)